MDVYCPKCDEPIDLYEFHDIAEEHDSTFTKTQRSFMSGSCQAIGLICNTPVTRDPGKLSRGEATSVLADILGDDVDGIAAMLEDSEYMF